MAERKPGGSANIFNDPDIDDSLLDSPVKPAPKSKGQASRPVHAPKPNYEDNETRDAALRQELANVRKVNETIEGVIQSLDKAKTNMNVGSPTRHRIEYCTDQLDCQSDCRRCIIVAKHVDSHPLSDRAQPASDSRPTMARRESGHG
jgi:hypothetical protein